MFATYCRSDLIAHDMESLREAVATDGAVAVAVNRAVAEAAKPLTREVERLARAVNAQVAVEGLKRVSPSKGVDFESELVAALQPWKRQCKAAGGGRGALSCERRQGW